MYVYVYVYVLCIICTYNYVYVLYSIAYIYNSIAYTYNTYMYMLGSIILYICRGCTTYVSATFSLQYHMTACMKLAGTPMHVNTRFVYS